MDAIVTQKTGFRRKAEAPAGASPLGVFAWAVSIAAGIAVALVAIPATLSLGDARALAAGSENEVRARLESDWPEHPSAAWLEVLSERAIELSPPDAVSSRRAAERALQLDPGLAFAWARLADIEALTAGKATAAGFQALRKSILACRYCSDALSAWRLKYVLANWSATPEDLRKLAFDQADVLRWRPENAEMLAEIRIKAIGLGIPFDAYRGAVDTPVRPWEIGREPAPAPVAAR